MPADESKKNVAFITLESLFRPGANSLSDGPVGIHSRAKDALHQIQGAGYHEVIFLHPYPLTEYVQALAWLKRHNLRRVPDGTAGHGETYALYAMGHIANPPIQPESSVWWMIKRIREIVADRETVHQVLLLDKNAAVLKDWIPSSVVPGLARCEILAYTSIEALFADKQHHFLEAQ